MRTYSKKYAFILVALYIALQRTLPRLFTQKTMGREILLRLGLGLIAFCFVYLIVGKRVFSYFGKGTGCSISRLLILCLPSFLLCAMALSLSFGTEEFVQNWLMQLLRQFVLFLSVGFYEEMVYRVLINDAVLTSLNKRKHVFLYAALISAFLFGVTHIIDSSFHSNIEVISALLKIVSAGMIGTAFLFMFWKTENILGCMIIHMLFDFLPSIGSCLFEDTSVLHVEYVMDGRMGIMAISVYCLEILWASYILFRLWKNELQDADFAELRSHYSGGER